MKSATSLAISSTLFLIIGALVRAWPGLGEGFGRQFVAFGCMVGLAVAAAASAAVARWGGPDSPQRRPWLLFAVGFGLWSIGQAILVYYYVVLEDPTAFPSPADPFYVCASALIAVASFWFAVGAQRSGLPFGSPMRFWTPGLVVIAFAAVGIHPLLAPVIRAGGAGPELFLNVYYPSIDLVAMIPCAVMVRVAFRFRGGRLIFTWLPITLGITAVLVSDILFSYTTALGMDAVRGVMDYLYYAGYVVLAHGILHQVAVVRSSAARAA